MKLVLGTACLAAAAISTPVLADPPPVNVDGAYHCIAMCPPGFEGGRAFIGQSGWDVNLVSESGNAATGYIEWPRRIWIDKWDTGANVSPDGMKVQFDNGEVWVRELPVVRGPRPMVYAPVR